MNPRRPLPLLPITLITLAASWCATAWAVDLRLPGRNRTVRVGLSQTLIGEYHSDVDVVAGNESPAYFDVKNRTGIVIQHGGWMALEKGAEGGRRIRIHLPVRA